jgi:cytochrome d ubiquinol oxidase subunit I
MAMSLGFHIIFAVVGIGMPVLMVIAERRWHTTGEKVYLELARRWAKGTAILFAVGAVSGTVLSFELGLLWPEFMRSSGAIIGMPFSLEGFAFFTEAIFLGIYLYGWNRISRRSHLIAGILVAVSGAASGIFVTIANAWMNAPTGFRLVNGQFTDIDPIAGMFNPASLEQTIHMTIAAYAATGFAVAGIHALLLLFDPQNAFHRRALGLGLALGIPAALAQPFSGDLSGRSIAKRQPAKLAAAEALFETRTEAPLTIGGWPDMEARRTPWSVEIPGGLSFLAFHDFHAKVLGLDSIPRDQWPHVPTVHLAFQIMVGLGMYLVVIAVWVIVEVLRRRDLSANRPLLMAVAAAAPFGFIAIEAGWTVTEVGRQPWIIYGVLRTASAVTPMPGLVVPFVVFTLLYCFLGVVVAWLLYSQIVKSPTIPEWTRTYSPVRPAA